MKSEPRLIYYIRQYNQKGYSRKKIEDMLSLKGYTPNDIEQGIDEYHKANDFGDEDKLVEYFESHLKKQFSLDELIDHALERGVDKHLIQRAVLRTKLPVQASEVPQVSPVYLGDVAKEEQLSDYVKPQPFTWGDVMLLFPTSAAIILSFYDVFIPFVTVILLSLYVLRIIGVNPKPLGHIALVSGIVFCVIAALYLPLILPFVGAMLLLVSALLLYVPQRMHDSVGAVKPVSG